MPFDIAVAVKLGRFVNDAYVLTGSPSPSAVKLSDATFTVNSVLYGDDKWDSVDGYVPFGFIAQSSAAPYTVVVSVRGTENVWDWMADATFVRKSCPLPSAPVGAETEDGFTSLYLTLRTGPTAAATPLKSAVQACIAGLGAANVAQVFICGHSLGGALATLIACDLAGSKIASPSVYTFASPAVGEKSFAIWYDSLAPDSYRIVNLPDIVPDLPPSVFGYTHVDEPYPINTGAATLSSVPCHHSLDSYLHALDPTQPLTSACAIPPAPA